MKGKKPDKYGQNGNCRRIKRDQKRWGGGLTDGETEKQYYHRQKAAITERKEPEPSQRERNRAIRERRELSNHRKEQSHLGEKGTRQSRRGRNNNHGVKK